MVKKQFIIFLFSTSLFAIHADAYPIVGNWPVLNPTQLTILQKWRESASQLYKAHPHDITINGSVHKKMVALTFDDGPDAKVTPAILDTLKKYGIKATFFFLGNRLEKYKEIVTRAHNEGHAVLSHTWNHKKLITLSVDEITDELTRTHHALESLLGNVPRIFRPPYGVLNELVIKTYKKLGYHAALWSLDTLDWANKEKQAIASTVTEGIRPGEIILMHSNDDKQATADSLPIIIEWIIKQGYGFARIDDVIFNPTIKSYLTKK